MGKLKRKIDEAVDMPESSFGACPYMELEGNHSIRIDECIEILSYDEEETVLKLKGMTVTIAGRGLTMSSYGGGTIRLTGVISNILLSDGQL